MERHLVEYLANACWQLPLLAAGAWLLLRMVRPRPAVQHGLWLAVLGLALVLPFNVGGRVKIIHPAQVSAATQAAAFSDSAFDSIGTPRGLVLGSAGWNHMSGVQPIFSTLEWCTRVHVLSITATLAGWIVGIYLLVGLVGLTRILLAWRSARRLVEGSRAIALTKELKAAVADCSRRVGVEAPEVRESSEIAGPVVVGARKPVLLLPDEFQSCSQEELMAALCHEMAHIRRRDYLMNLICAGAALPLKWHPAMHGVERRIRSTREMVCDAVAAKAMQSEMVYAKCLLSLAQSMVAGAEMSSGADSVAAGLFNGNALEERMMRLLQGTAAMNVRAKLARGVMGGAAMLAAFGVAAVFHVCLATAQTQTAPNSANAAQAPSGVQGGVGGGVKGGAEGGVQGGVTAGQPTSDKAKGSEQPVVTEQWRTVRVATDMPVVVHVAPLAEVHVAPMEPVVHVVPAVNVRLVVSDIHVSPVNIANIAPDVHLMRVSPIIHVAPITPIVQVAPEVPQSQATPPAPPAPAAPAAPPTQAAPAAPAAPPAPPAPPAQAAPAAPPAPAPPAAPEKKSDKVSHSDCPYSMTKLTPEQRQRVEKQMEEAQRKVQESMTRLNSPEFRKEIEDAQRRATEAAQRLDSGEFQKQMTDAQKRVEDAQARLNSSEFKKQMEEAQQKAMEAERKMNSAEFQKQMAEAQDELAGAQAKLNSPEFRKRIEDAQRQAADAAQKLNNGEFQKQMAEAQRKLAEALAKMKADEATADTTK